MELKDNLDEVTKKHNMLAPAACSLLNTVLYSIHHQVALEVYTGLMAYDKQHKGVTLVRLEASSATCILSFITCMYMYMYRKSIGRTS